jgi:uncharacterized LabA/DUF88 family protein
LAHQDRLNIAVFIDFDNIEIGVKSTLGEHFDVGTILEALRERGEVVTKIAYADWTRAGEYSRHLTQHAIRLVQRNLTPGGDKNGADINLALDALEMAFTHPHINAYVIVGGDSDFLSLVEKLKQYDKKVFVVGGRAFTSVILQRNCHEFIAYENLRRPAAKSGGRPQAPMSAAPIAQAFPLVRRALKILSDREVSPQTGLLKSTLLQLDSTFSERNYGASSFLDFAEKLAKEGVVTLKHAGRSVMVELNGAFTDGGAATETVETPPPADNGASGRPHDTQQAQRPEPVAATESAAAGVARAAQILAAAKSARWPMYLRNVKQILRQAEGGFDERRYGFNGLMDLLKALQRESTVRIERDRRGGLRVFQGSALQRHAQSVPMEGLPKIDPALEAEMAEAGLVPDVMPAVVIEQRGEADADPSLDGPMPIDTTAELLGRAKARKPRVAAGRMPRVAVAGTRKAAKKPAARRTSRARKAAEETQEDSDS